MHTLSGLDALFLYLETPQTPMHIGSFSLYAPPELLKGSLHKAIKAHIAKRLHLAPVFSRKLGLMPLDMGHPVWVDAETVDLNFHIRQVKANTLTVREAESICAELHSRLMDRSQPLWEFHVFEHIQRPDGSLCAGVYSKIHHAALDGKGGTVLTNAIMDVGPVPRDVPLPRRSRRARAAPALNTGAMISAVLSTSLSQYVNLIKALPRAARAFGSTLVKQTAAGNGQGGRRKSPIQLAPMTDFNVAITNERSFGTARLAFADCRTLARATGGTFNDIVLWICATALRTYLKKHGGIPTKSLLAAMPINLREEGNEDFNTQASMTVVELGTQWADPLKRLKTIMTSTAKVKTARSDLKDVIPTDFPSLLAPWVVGGAAKAAFKVYSAAGLSHHLPMMANLVISNVPGPKAPLYMAGGRMLTFHPLSIVIHGVALNITIQTYAGQVDFGVIADKRAVPEVHDLTNAILQAFELGRQVLTPSPVPMANPTPVLAAPVPKKAGKKAI